MHDQGLVNESLTSKEKMLAQKKRQLWILMYLTLSNKKWKMD